jgi:hypothetical protein
MKTANEVLLKLIEIKKEQIYYQEKQSNFEFTELELIEGSSKYSELKEREISCKERIRLLEWVINLNDKN